MIGPSDFKPTACKEFEQDLILYYYGDPAGGESGAIETHIKSCHDCAMYLRGLASLLPKTVKEDEPPSEFWDNYSREMRHKLAEIRDRQPWWHGLYSLFNRWTLPALATTAVIALALTFTLGKTLWSPKSNPTDDEAFMEVLPLAENLEFFKTMEVLDAMDLLEYMGSSANGSA